MKKCMLGLIALTLVLTPTLAADSPDNLHAEIQALQQRVAELEAQQSQQAVQQRNAELMRQMVAELADQMPSASAMQGVTAGYDKGFFIKTTDDQFRLNFDSLLQVRHTYHKYDDCGGNGQNTSASNAELERAKLYLSGHVLKDLDYRIQLESDDDNADGTWLQEYEVSYLFVDPEFGVRVGRFRPGYGKQENTSSQYQMFVDRSLANETFNISRGSGVEIFGALPVMPDTNLHYQAGVFNGFRDERSRPLADYDNNPAVAARLCLPLMGADKSDFVNESDLEFHDNPVLQAGCSFAYSNAKDEDTLVGGDEDNYGVVAPGQAQRMVFVPAYGETTLLGADVAFKYQGLSLIGEAFYQNADLDNIPTITDPLSPLFGQRVTDGDSFDNSGWYTQAGYFVVPETFELITRVGGVCIEDAGSTMEYAAGWNYYISGQDLKLSMDVTYVDDMIPIVSNSANYAGVTDEALIMVRTQLQFMF